VYKYASGAIYEGEWKNDVRHGKGVYMYPDGTEGEWKDDVWNGKGLLRQADGTIIYKGEWKDGVRNER
jgi:hypothetical protein